MTTSMKMMSKKNTTSGNKKTMVQFYSLLAMALIAANANSIAMTTSQLWSRNSREYVRLRILDECFSEGEKPRVTVVEKLGNSMQLKVPIRNDSIICMRCTLNGEGQSSAGPLVERDGGLFDSLDKIKLESKRTIYEAVKFGGRGKPYQLLLDALTKELGELREAILEDAWPASDGIRLEGLVSFDTGAQIECFADEALGLALVSSCPLAIRRDLFEKMSAIESTTEEVRSKTEKQTDLIKTAAEYLALTNDEKVNLILSANIPSDNLPRPRKLEQEPDALDLMLLPLVDEIVRREVLIEKAISAGDIQTAARLTAEKSERHRAYDAAVEASEWGDLSAEVKARDEMAILEAARADPTQDPGSYSTFLDRDPWYEEQLRRNRQKLQ